MKNNEKIKKKKDILKSIILRRKIYRHEIKDERVFNNLMELSQKVDWLEWEKENQGFFRTKLPEYKKGVNLQKINTKKETGIFVKYWHDKADTAIGVLDYFYVFNTTGSKVLVELVTDKSPEEVTIFLTDEFNEQVYNDFLKVYEKGMRTLFHKRVFKSGVKNNYPGAVSLKPFEYKKIFVVVAPDGLVTLEKEKTDEVYHLKFSGKDFEERTKSFPKFN